MKCRRVQDRLVAYLAAELPGEGRTAVEKHLRDCPRCRAELSRQRRLDDLLAQAPGCEPPAGFAAEVRRAAERSEPAALPFSNGFSPALTRIAATVALVVGLGLGGVLGTSAARARTAGDLSPEQEGAGGLVEEQLLSTAPQGSVTETYLEWTGELEQ